MDKKTLSGYRSRVIRIAKLKEVIDDIKQRDVQVVAGKVNSSLQVFPYTPCRVAVQMRDPQEVDKQNKQITKREKEISILEAQNKQVEDFIDRIPDPTAKSIFEYYYTDGIEQPTQKEIAPLVGVDQKNISSIIKKYLEEPA